MLFISLKPDDNAFVSKAIIENGLDPRPSQGFHAQPDYWQETARWKRVVERYKWGAVIFLSDRDRKLHATMVAIGTIELSQGKVSTQGGWKDFPGWYREMALELQTKRRGVKLEVPSCLGYREPDVTCDGGKNLGDRIEPACSWRDRCIAVQLFCINNNRLQEDILKGKSSEQIIQLTTRLLENSGAIAPKPKKERVQAVQAPPESAAETTPAEMPQAVPRNASGADPVQSAAVLAVVVSVMREVASAAGINVSADNTKTASEPGDLYLVDRTANSDYIGIYLATKPKPAGLAVFRIRARTGLMVQLPIPKDSPLLAGVVDSDVREWKDGAFQCAVRDVPLEGNRLDHIKNIMVSLIKERQ